MREAAEQIVRTLTDHGFIALFAGGCVRDMLLHVTPEDYDIATSATPEQVCKIFERAIPVGAKFGVVVVPRGTQTYEVSTFRTDGEYTDGRRPDRVAFSDPETDVQRRDFTINGLLYDPLSSRLIDHVGGQADLAEGVIRTIGPPHQRFREDRLRLFRAVRFAARFDYEIEPVTYSAIEELAETITQVSAERIRDELTKLLTGPRAGAGLDLLQRTGLLRQILPEVEALKGTPQPPKLHPEGDVFIHTKLMLDSMRSPSAELAMGVLLHDVGKPPTLSVEDRIRFNGHNAVGARMAEEICRRLRFSNDSTERIVSLVREHMRFMDIQKARASRVKRFLRLPHFEEHLELHRLDCIASHGDRSAWEFCKALLDELEDEQIRPPRLVTGHDLIEWGHSPGPRFAEILRSVEDAQLEGQVRTKEEARSLVQREFPVATEGVQASSVQGTE